MNKKIISQLDHFFTQFPPVSYEKNEVIIRAEDAPQGVYYVKSGFVRLYTLSLDGRELTFNIFKAGSFFSMMWALSEIPNSYYFQAMTSAELYHVPKEKLTEFLKENPDVLFDLTRRILSGMSGLITQMEFLLFGNSAARVISTILMSARRFGEKGNNNEVTITLPLTHREIADIAGLTRETTSLEMKKLENGGFIRHNNKKCIVVSDVHRLSEELETRYAEETVPYAF